MTADNLKNYDNLSMDKLRNSIDEIDDSILDLINQRLKLAKQIGLIKKQNLEQVMDNLRERQIMQRLIKKNQGPLDNKVLTHIFTDIIAVARNIQNPLQVTYLGPEATFTHLAALSHFGDFTTLSPQTSIRDVFIEVEKGNYQYGVVPVENSIEGSVNHTLDLFFESRLKICAEKYQTIHHDLLSKDGLSENIKIIYSHPQALAQCRRWLRRHLPLAELKECQSTAQAAQKAAQEQEGAAIAGSEAARIYNLKVVSSKIEDFAHNVTRFLIIGKDTVHQSGQDKTSVMFVTPHAPGALSKLLEPLAKSSINMVKLESRPTKYENWSYIFFVDLEGHVEDPKVQVTLEEMKNLSLYLKWIGSYPKEEK